MTSQTKTHLNSFEVTWNEIIGPRSSDSEFLNCNVYAVIDGVAEEQIYPQLQHQLASQYSCLYFGTSVTEQMKYHSPWLVKLEEDEPFLEWFINRKADNYWGFLVLTHLDLYTLRQHLRHFTMAYIPSQEKPVYFRFYDSRGLIDYLQTCDAEELAKFIGQNEAYLVANIEKPKTFTGYSMNGKTKNCFLNSSLGGAFHITDLQYDDLSKLQGRRQVQKMGSEFYQLYQQSFPNKSKDDFVSVAEFAMQQGERFGLENIRAVKRLAAVILVTGERFFLNEELVAAIFSAENLSVEEKFNYLESIVIEKSRTSHVN